MGKKFSIEAIFGATDRLSAPIAKIRGKLAGLGTVSNKALKGMNRLADRGLGAVGKASSALGIAGVVSIGALGFQLQDTLAQGAELEKTLIRTGSAFEQPVRVGTEGFARLTDAARLVGTTTEFAAQQGADGLNSLATAGYTLDQSIAALPKVINFSSAAVLELDQASDITSDTLGAFSLRTADATKNAAAMGRVMDVLSRTAADSTTNVTELFEGIKAGGAYASTTGASLEDFAAIQGVLANKGYKGAEAGTAIRNAYLHLTTQTSKAKDTMRRLGVQTALNKDGSIDMITTIGRFSKATAKLTGAKKGDAIATVFGAFTVGQFLSLMDAGEGTLRSFKSNVENATGVTDKMAEAMRGSRAAQIAMFFNKINDVKLGVFDAIAPTVMDIAASVGKWTIANKDLINTKAAEYVTTLRENLPAIATWTERIAKAVAALVVVSAVVKIITAIVTVAGWLATAFTWISFTATLIGVSAAALAGTFLLIGAAIAGVVYVAYKYWPEISGFFTKLKDWAVEKITSMWAWIVGAFNVVKPYLVAAFEFFAGFFALAFAPQIAFAKWFWQQLGQFAADGVELFTVAWSGISAFFSGLWDGLLVNLRAAKDLWIGVWGELTGAFDRIWQSIAAGYDKYVAPVIDQVLGLVNVIRTVGRIATGSADAEGGAATTTAPGSGAAQVVSPQARAARETAEATDGRTSVDGTITVKAEPGTSASVKAKPRGVPIRLAASGAFP